MANFGARRHFLAACLCGALALAAGSKASGQDASVEPCTSGLDASAEASAPYVKPPPTTCDPSNYISTADSATGPTSPGPNMWPGPPGYDASPPTVSGDIYAMLGITNPNATTFTYTSVQAPYPDAAGCKAFDSQGHQAVHDCLCTNCFNKMQQCDALTGCRAIIKCAWDSGCDPSASISSATSCYPLTAAGGCKTPIDQYGTGSVSTALSQQVGLCGISNGCPRQ